MAHSHRASPLAAYRGLLPYLARYRGRYAAGFLCLVAVDGAQVLIPQCMARALDLIAGGAFTLRAIGALAALMAGLALVIAGGRFAWRYFIHGSARRIEAALRDDLFAHLCTLDYRFYQQQKIGDLMARATNDLDAVRHAIGMGVVALVDGTLMAAAILVIIFVQDTRTAALAVLPLPVISVLILVFGKAVGRRFFRAQEAYSAMSGEVQETFAGIRVVKSFVLERWFLRVFADKAEASVRANMELARLFGFFFPFVTFLSGLTILITLVAGGIQTALGALSPGSLLALFSYLQMLVWPIMGAGFTVNMLQRGAASLARIQEVLSAKSTIQGGTQIPSPQPPVPSILAACSTLNNSMKNSRDFTLFEAAADKVRRGLCPLGVCRVENCAKAQFSLSNSAKRYKLLECRNFSFTYPEGSEAIRGLSFSLPAGHFLGVLGRTGAGKSTLLKAFPRMIDPPAGTVFVKGVDVRDWDLAALRAVFGLSPQDSYLFSDTLRANIRYGLAEGAERLPFEEAVSIAALAQDLPAFSAGYDTLVGERGVSLSGGQKQRVAIARALLPLPEVLLLDDSLSAVDAQTERRILGGLSALRQRLAAAGRPLSLVIVTHRESVLKDADQVIVLGE
ncbi:MAG: ABC transporter ATP-binding protein/permease [Treponema sp.]|jgi:ATP-binding cassette subfamily B protein|nr:ABC transporter ATP-binding protein/permease [Treponema sp.]